MSKLSQKLKNITKTPYQIIAEKYNVSAKYVGMIARGERIPVRGNGLKVKEAVDKLLSEES